MSKVQQQQKMFMVRVVNGATATSTGCHLAIGGEALTETVVEKLGGKLSSSSKDRLRAMVEDDQDHVVAMFRGHSALALYNATESRRVDVVLVMDSRGLA